jgi:hypothetical protein
MLDDARGAADGSRTLATQWLSRNSPSAPDGKLRPLIEIGENKSLRREPSARHSKGGVASERWRCLWRESG